MAVETLAKLVHEFSEGVIAQKESLRQRDSKAGNREANRYISAWKKLRSHGDKGREALAALLNDERTDVRAMAAAFLLRYCPDRAQQILRDIAQGNGLAAFGAAETLRRWSEGDWELDPEE